MTSDVAKIADLRREVVAGRIDRRAALRLALAAGASLTSAAAAFAAAPVPVKSTRSAAPIKQRVDWLIVGGGTAGAVLAHRLSADPQTRVVLLEGGGWPDDAAIDTPAAWPSLQGGRNDRAYRTMPQPNLDGRVLPCPRGIGFGGSSLLNAMGHQRGHPGGYDRWEALGATGWNHAALLPMHRRSETFSGGADAWRGGDGPLDVLAVSARDASPVANAFFAAARGRGYGWTEDFNGANPGEACWNQFTITRDRTRDHAARAFLEPVAGRPNLTLLGDAPVERLVFAGQRCIGVRYRHAERIVELRAERGVILTAGAIDTPKILMLSGIGPADHLRAHGVEVRLDHAEVGQNLHDHPLVGGVAFEARRAVPLSAYNHGEGMLFAKLGASPVPDVLLMAVTVPFVIPSVGAAPENCFTFVPCVMQPRSRGRVRLAGADFSLAPIIDPATYEDSKDLELMVDAVELARDLGRSREMADWVLREVHPGPAIVDRSALRQFVRRGTSPFYHPVGTLRMGSDARAPVTPELAVRGVSGLYVADASVMPQIVPAMTNAAVVAIAERAAQLLVGQRAVHG
jgi:choline dehydrogenase